MDGQTCIVHSKNIILERLTIVRSPEVREEIKSLPARAHTIVLCAPDTAGPWSAVTIRHISKNCHKIQTQFRYFETGVHMTLYNMTHICKRVKIFPSQHSLADVSGTTEAKERLQRPYCFRKLFPFAHKKLTRKFQTKNNNNQTNFGPKLEAEVKK